MSDEQKNVDDGKRWQVDYDCNLVWEQTSKSNTNLNELKKLFGYAERFYDILPSSFEKYDSKLFPTCNGCILTCGKYVSLDIE